MDEYLDDIRRLLLNILVILSFFTLAYWVSASFHEAAAVAKPDTLTCVGPKKIWLDRFIDRESEAQVFLNQATVRNGLSN